MVFSLDHRQHAKGIQTLPILVSKNKTHLIDILKVVDGQKFQIKLFTCGNQGRKVHHVCTRGCLAISMVDLVLTVEALKRCRPFEIKGIKVGFENRLLHRLGP